MDKTSSGSVTIKDIARQLGMSHTTVSRALNDHPQTNRATKERVRRVADELGYVAHSGARSMRHGHGRVIGLVLPVLATDFYQTVAIVLADHARHAGYQLILAITEDEAESECDQVQTLLEARAAGIIIAPTATPLPRTIALLAGTTCIQINRFVSTIDADAIGFDDAAGVRAATAHLVSLGHRRIGLIGGTTRSSPGAERLRGYREVLDLVKLPFREELVRLGDPRSPFGSESMLDLLAQSDPPTAVLFTSSEVTTGALLALRQRQHSIPRDISVIAFADPPWYSLLDPPLTTISLPVAALAEMTASILFSRVERKKTSRNTLVRQPTRFPVQPELLIRGSTGPVRSRRR